MSLKRSPLVPLAFALFVGGCASSVSVGTATDSGRDGGSSAGDGAVSTLDAFVPGPDAEVPPPEEDVPAPPVDDVTMPPRPDVAPPPADTSFPVEPDGAVIYPPDAGYEPGTACGMSRCTDAQECCPDRMTRMLTCVPRGSCMLPSATCDGPEDCPSSQRCCYGGATGGRLDMGDVACFPEAMCARIPVVGALRACHTNADCPATARRCCNVTGMGFGGFMVPAGLPRVCSPICPGGG